MTILMPPAIAALQRKLTRSFTQRGLLPTLKRCITKPLQVVRNLLRYALPSERQYRTEEREFDQLHHVDTRVDRDPGWMASIASPNWMHGIGYAPVPLADLRGILAGLDLQRERSVFIDLGAGKGRALFIAAEFPFKRVVGVEYSPKLAAILQRNIATYHNPRQCCHDLTGILEDASLYVLPEDPLVLFFHHPFEGVVFRQVVERIEASLDQHWRRILAIYYDPKCRTVFDDSLYFRRLQQGRSQYAAAAGAEWIVYEACPPSNREQISSERYRVPTLTT